MKQWLVPYTKIPTFHNPPHTAIVEAYDEEGARQLVRHRLNDFGKVSAYVIEAAREYQPGSLTGKILSMG
jgi:hypothetical protein